MNKLATLIIAISISKFGFAGSGTALEGPPSPPVSEGAFVAISSLHEDPEVDTALSAAPGYAKLVEWLEDGPVSGIPVFDKTLADYISANHPQLHRAINECVSAYRTYKNQRTFHKHAEDVLNEDATMKMIDTIFMCEKVFDNEVKATMCELGLRK